MKSTKRLFLTLLTVAALFAGTWAQTSDSTTPPHKKTHKAVAAQTAATAADVQALKDAIAAQQQQIQQLTQQLQQLLQNSQQAQQTSQQAQATAAEAASKAAAARTQTRRKTAAKRGGAEERCHGDQDQRDQRGHVAARVREEALSV